MTIDSIFRSIRKGHLDLIDHVKKGVPWNALSEEVRYHLVHKQLAHVGGVHDPIASVIAAGDVHDMQAMIGRMAA